MTTTPEEAAAARLPENQTPRQKPRPLPAPRTIDIQLSDVHHLLPDLYRRYATLHNQLWVRPAGNPDIIVMGSGHSDPTGNTVVASIPDRNHLAHAGQLILDLCATARGIDAALHRAAGTTPIDGNPDAPSVARKVRPCVNCRDLPGTRRGRCEACAQYHARTGTERPAHLWQQPHHK